jgi:hypothetical protein
VKATVDAYDGTVRLYEWDEEDPILQAWQRVFPGTVQPKDEIPDGVLEHLRYPEDLFKVQRYHFARYHETDAREWYDGNSRWEVPEDPYERSTFQAPYRLFVNEGGEKTYALTSVYVPRGKANLVSFMSVNSDATSSDYGRMEALELPNERTAGPGQIANELSSDQGVRQQLLSFSAGNTKPVYGNLLTLPVGDGLMYVQPLYAQRDLGESSFPILRFALVSYGGRVGIGNTLTDAIADVLGVDPDTVDSGSAPSTGGGGGGPRGGEGGEGPPAGIDAQITDLLTQAEAKFAAADQAQAQGDTVRWARLMEQARELVDQAVELAESR